MLNNNNLTLGKDNNKLLDIAHALSSPQRLEILQLLNTRSMSVKELSIITNTPLSSTLLNINILENAGLINVEETFTKKGKSKLCSRNVDKVDISIYKPTINVNNSLTIEIPIGNYSSYDIPYNIGCGIATKEHTIGIDNNTDVFFSDERFKAGYIWFTKGFLEYRLSNKNIPSKLSKISITFEVCSEAPFYRNDWKSDISMFLNNHEIGTWTSLGDYGGRRGKNNPKWWSDALTQFGVLTTWEIRNDGTYVNDQKISNFKIIDLNIKENDFLSLKFGVKDDAKYCGGISLFGKTFGDYNQDIIVSFYWN